MQLPLKEKAGGRELTDEEMELAWRSYKWNSLNGLSEVMPMMRLFKHLSKVAPKATNRLSQTIDDISIKNPYTTEAIRAGVIEGTQEFHSPVLVTLSPPILLVTMRAESCLRMQVWKLLAAVSRAWCWA